MVNYVTGKATNTFVEITSNFEEWVVKAGVTMAPDTKLPFVQLSSFSNATVTVAGTIDGWATLGSAMYMVGTQNKVIVADGGLVDDNATAIMLGAFGTVINHGTILGKNAVDAQTVINDGVIKGTQTAIEMHEDGASVVNKAGGKMSSLDTILCYGSGENAVTNSGTIGGTVSSFKEINDSTTTFINNGKVTGAVILGLGNDTYTANAASTQAQVFGGGGSDTFVIHTTAITIVEMSGDAGIDTVSSSVSIKIADNVEYANAIGKRDITLRGNDQGIYLADKSSGDTILKGGSGEDILVAGGGNNQLFGGLSDDTLISGRGSDRLTGGGGADLFEFRPNSGNDVITDFQNGIDTIQLTSIAGVGSFDDLKDNITKSGSDLLITLDDGSTIRILNLSKADFDQSDVTIAF